MDVLGEKISQNAQNFDKIVQKLEKKIENQAKINDFSNIEKIIQDINKYSIKDGKWFYGDIDLGIKAEAVDGKDFKFEDFTKEQLELLRGPQGLPGKDGKDGKDGINGKPGIDGKPGKDGKDGEDAETPTFKIGNIESVSTYDNAEVSLDKDGNAYTINMKIPRGRPGKDGADGSSESGGGGVSNYNDLTNKPKINGVELVDNKTNSDLKIPMEYVDLSSDTKTLQEIGEGCYIVSKNGTINTASGYSRVIGKGTEIIIVRTNKSGIPTLCATFQDGANVYRIDDDASSANDVKPFLKRSDIDTELTESSTDKKVPSSKAVYEFVKEYVKEYVNNIIK